MSPPFSSTIAAQRVSRVGPAVKNYCQAVLIQAPATMLAVKLQQLKQMLDGELITQQEHDAKKVELVTQM